MSPPSPSPPGDRFGERRLTSGALTLPTGLWLDGEHHREVEVRAIDGSDEAFLRGPVQERPPAVRANGLVRRCVRVLGSDGPVPEECLLRLTVGDREAILLHLRRASVGERLSCLVTCPGAACGGELDVDLDVGDLLVPPYPDPRPLHEETLGGGGNGVRLTFRLPTAGDLEAVLGSFTGDARQAARLLARRCVQTIDGETGGVVRWDPPDSVLGALSRRMSELDPQADLVLEMACPDCGETLPSTFDAGANLLDEVDARANHLAREVHLLALHYGWGLSEILALTFGERASFLTMLEDSLGGASA